MISTAECCKSHLCGLLYSIALYNSLCTDYTSTDMHLLIVCCTGLIYMPIVLGLVALGAHMSRNTLRVLARLDEGR